MRALFLPLVLLGIVLLLEWQLRPHRIPPPAPPSDYVQAVPGTDVSFQMTWLPKARIWLGTHEVTWHEYEAYYFSKNAKDGTDALARPTPSYIPHDMGWGTGRMPALGISQHAAEQYCVWLSAKTGVTYRLPTNEEWEAGRVPLEDADAEAWFADNSDGRPHEVGSKAPNALGLHDMHGNVWEYCQGPFPGDEWDNPLMRGGSWNSSAEEITGDVRMACPAEAWNDSDPNRPRGIWWLPDGPYVGFRVARSAD